MEVETKDPRTSERLDEVECKHNETKQLGKVAIALSIVEDKNFRIRLKDPGDLIEVWQPRLATMTTHLIGEIASQPNLSLKKEWEALTRKLKLPESRLLKLIPLTYAIYTPGLSAREPPKTLKKLYIDRLRASSACISA